MSRSRPSHGASLDCSCWQPFSGLTCRHILGGSHTVNSSRGSWACCSSPAAPRRFLEISPGRGHVQPQNSLTPWRLTSAKAPGPRALYSNSFIQVKTKKLGGEGSTWHDALAWLQLGAGQGSRLGHPISIDSLQCPEVPFQHS